MTEILSMIVNVATVYFESFLHDTKGTGKRRESKRHEKLKEITRKR